MRIDALGLGLGLAGVGVLAVTLAWPTAPERALAEAARRAIAAARPGDCLVLSPSWEARRLDALAASPVPVFAASSAAPALALGCSRVWLLRVPGVGLDALPLPFTSSAAPGEPQPVEGAGPWLVSVGPPAAGSPP
jgi:hypothetical protein